MVLLLLSACGGGGDATHTPTTPTSVNAVPDDLTSASDTPGLSQNATLCGVDVGGSLLQGVVTDVHDGDTLTLKSAGTTHKIRLDSIDAPELAQPFGSLSQTALASVALNKTVQVAYAKLDRYDRIIGAVFTDTCQYVNLAQVQSGMAWFYQAYQCEISAADRQQFLQAQNNAVAARMGLWSDASPTAPWVYRNGVDPTVPACTSASKPVNATATTTSGSAVASGVCPKVWVNSYVRSDGTQVKGYWRDSPGCS